MDATETDDPSLVGEICHIIAESEDGPRGHSHLTEDERNKYGNLILLCCIHHKLIDDQPNHYSVERLGQIKLEHEEFVRASLDVDGTKQQREQELVAGYIDVWNDRCGLDEWNAWTSFLLAPEPSVEASRFDELRTIPEWLLARIWPPHRFAKIQESLRNFRWVLNDFSEVFRRHREPLRDGQSVFEYRTKKFYQIDDYDEARYFKLLRQYECHVSLIFDYVYELTRAANNVCDSIRYELLHSFRIEQGALLVTRGADMSFKYRTYRPEYVPSDFPDLYQGEEDFNKRRLTRDVCEGDEKDVALLEERFKAFKFP